MSCSVRSWNKLFSIWRQIIHHEYCGAAIFLVFLNISKKTKNKTKNQLYFFYFIKMDLKSCDLYFLYTQENIVK